MSHRVQSGLLCFINSLNCKGKDSQCAWIHSKSQAWSTIYVWAYVCSLSIQNMNLRKALKAYETISHLPRPSICTWVQTSICSGYMGNIWSRYNLGKCPHSRVDLLYSLLFYRRAQSALRLLTVYLVKWFIVMLDANSFKLNVNSSKIYLSQTVFSTVVRLVLA